LVALEHGARRQEFRPRIVSCISELLIKEFKRTISEISKWNGE